MKAVLVEHKLQIPEELQPKVKAMLALFVQIISERHKVSPQNHGIRNIAFEKLRANLYREITGVTYGDYPVWDVSDSCDELIGYRYEFQAESITYEEVTALTDED